MTDLNTKSVIGMIDIHDYLNKYLDNKYVVKGIMEALKLKEIFEQDLVDWKSSSEMKPECGHAMMTQPFVEKIYSVLKSMKEESEK